MKLLLKNIKVVDQRSSYYQKKVDILIHNGVISKIGRNLNDDKARKISLVNAHASLGWIDIGTQVGEPGYEHRETIETVVEAAKAGGYTALVSFPNTNPVVQTKSDIQYLKTRTENGLVEIFPTGAVSKNCEGKDLNELIDMRNAGAVAFSDGELSIQNSGTLLRALQYIKSFNGVIIQQTTDTTLVPGAYVHEGEISTRMGLKGIPAIAEEIQLERDLKLLSYSDSRMLIHNVSSASSISLLKKSSVNSNNLASSVAFTHLIFHDEDLLDYDPLYKIMPPLRDKKDRNRLVKAVSDGTISIINSNHNPQDQETKSLEFAHASFGVTGLETCFAAINTYLNDLVGLEILVDCLSYNGRKMLGLPIPKIEEGEAAILTLFDPELKWTFEKSDIKSKSDNTPFVGVEFTGKVLGTVNNNMINLV